MGRLNDEDRRREDFIQDRKDDEARTIRDLKIDRGWLELGVTGYAHQSRSGYPKRAFASNLEFVSLRSHTGDDEPPEYRTWFPKSQADSLRLRITLRDKYFDKRVYGDPEHTYAIALRVYQPDGAVIDEAKHDVYVKADWEHFYWSPSIGKRHAGKWRPGVYGVEAFVQDELVGRHWFLIVGDSNESAITQHYPLPETGSRGDISLSKAVPANLWFKRLAFYDYGNSNSTQDVSRKFSTSFARATTRYIGFWMEVENPDIPETALALLGRLPTLYYDVKTTIYYPDGSLMGEPTYERAVPPKEQCLNWDHGWGWEKVGNWLPGVYGVQVSIDNVLMISGWFKIEDDTTNPLLENADLGTQFLALFERSRARHKAEGGISGEEVHRRLGL